MSAVRIVGYDPSYDAAFARLNYAWIEKYFGIERHDREQLDSPYESIIEPGGEIFFAVTDDGVVAGTVAMIRANDSTFELAKMAVDPEFQRRGIANLLLEACVDLACEQNARTIFLETNGKLPAAIALYRKYRFKDTPTDPNSEYARADVRMEFDVTAERRDRERISVDDNLPT